MNIYKKKSNVLGSVYGGIFSCAALQQSRIPELQIAESHYQPLSKKSLLTSIVCFFSHPLFKPDTERSVYSKSESLLRLFFTNNYFNINLSWKNENKTKQKSHFPLNNTSSPIFSSSPDHLPGLSSWSLISFSVKILFVSYYLFLTYKILEYTG